MPTGDDLAAFPALAGLGPDQRVVLAALATDVAFGAGQTIFAQGGSAARWWLIRSGRVALESDRPGWHVQIVQTMGPGDVLGWSWLVSPYRWRFGATAVDAVTALELDAVALRERAEQDPAFGYPLAVALMGALVPRLHGTRARLLDLYGSPRDR